MATRSSRSTVIVRRASSCSRILPTRSPAIRFGSRCAESKGYAMLILVSEQIFARDIRLLRSIRRPRPNASFIASISKVNYELVSVLTAVVLIAACSSEKMPGGGGLPASLKEVPSVRLNFRYEADVPAPETTEKTGAEERNAAVQAD